MRYSVADAVFRDLTLMSISQIGADDVYYYDTKNKIALSFGLIQNGNYINYSLFIGYYPNSYPNTDNIKGITNVFGGDVRDVYKDVNVLSSKVEGEYLCFYFNDKPIHWVSREDIYNSVGEIPFPDNCPGCNVPSLPGVDCDTPDCEENPNSNPKPNAQKPVIRDMNDITTYKGNPILVQFYAYDTDGYLTDFYFSLDGGETYGRFKPSFIGNSAYVAHMNFPELAEYNSRIKVIDNEGLSSESNVFKITVVPPLVPPVEPQKPLDVGYSDSIILYDKNSTEFNSNGIGILKDCTSCTVFIERNSMYELELSYPVGTRFDDYLMDEGNIIKANVDNCSNSQLFRIYETEYDMALSRIFVRARHITYDLKGLFIEGVSLLDVRCEHAAQTLISNSIGNCKNNFNVTSNISKKKNFSISKTNLLEAITGTENSIIDIYGNDKTNIYRDNFSIGINNKSVDNGVVIAYRKNLTGFKRRATIENVVTGVYPYSFTSYGKMITLKEKIIKVGNQGDYVENIIPIEFTDSSIVNESTLREFANSYISENALGEKEINYEVDFVPIYSSSKNSSLRKLEEVAINDIVTVIDERIGLSVKAMVIKTTYDVLSKRFKKIELGNFKNEYRKKNKKEYFNIRNIARSI